MHLTRREWLAALTIPWGVRAEESHTTELFRAGAGGYHSYRIPALIATRKGTLLAFCEGRLNSRSDSGDIDLLLRRSADQGRTWSKQQVVAGFGTDTIGNPCPVMDRQTGIIRLLLTRNRGDITQKQILDSDPRGTRTVWIASSTDDGLTWSAPEDITAQVKRPEWTWYATGPGAGIQLRSGRLLIPCDHYRRDTRLPHSHVIYSDDGGVTWRIGGVLSAQTDECQAAELRDGSVLINMRSYHGKNRRAIARSRDRGITFSEVTLDDALTEPVCQAALIRYNPRTLLFSNPASTKREAMTLRVSYDDGITWPVCRTLHLGPSAYSSLVALPRGDVGCLYERGDKQAYEQITFARVPWTWIAGRRRPELVDLATLDRSIKLDLRYASANNFVGRPVYREARAFLQRPAAQALQRAHRALRKHGYGLVIFDSYRPWTVTKLFWDITPPEKREFVANPAEGSRHNRGCAVDLSLYDLKTGKELPMPSGYDEMTERAYPQYSGGDPEHRRTRDLLRREMERQGFAVFPVEWWHFDYKDWPLYPVLDQAPPHPA